MHSSATSRFWWSPIENPLPKSNHDFDVIRLDQPWDDTWEDVEEDSQEKGGVIIPPRRRATDPDIGAGIREVTESGLRIESNVARLSPSASDDRLEVQEINGSVTRIENVVAALPKVPRNVKFHPRPPRSSKSKGKHSEEGGWGDAHRHPMRWIFVVGISVTAAVIIGLVALPGINATNAVVVDTEKSILVIEEEEKIEGAEALSYLLSKQPEALQILRSYARASHVDEVIPLVREGASLRDLLRNGWRPLGASKAWKPSAASWGVIEPNDKPVALLAGSFPDDSNFLAYFVQEGDHLLLDWKATTGFGTASFNELAKREGDSSEIRGEISQDTYYSPIWPENVYQSYRLISPNKDASIWCYARRDELANMQIAALFSSSGIIQETEKERRVTLRLEPGHEGSLPNQWLIAETLHIDWASP